MVRDQHEQARGRIRAMNRPRDAAEILEYLGEDRIPIGLGRQQRGKTLREIYHKALDSPARHAFLEPDQAGSLVGEHPIHLSLKSPIEYFGEPSGRPITRSDEVPP